MSPRSSQDATAPKTFSAVEAVESQPDVAKNEHDSSSSTSNTPGSPPQSKGRIAIIIFSLSLALFLSALDITIIATALPTIANHFEASTADYAWIGSSYLLAGAAAIPLWGKNSCKPIYVTSGFGAIIPAPRQKDSSH